MNDDEHVIRLVLADNHELTRAGIRATLCKTTDIVVVGEAQDGFEAKELTAQLRPHILLLDLMMPGPRLCEIERWGRANCPKTITLILTVPDRDAYLAEMKEAGAAGYLTKDISASRLVAAIRRAARGETLFDGAQLERVRRWREEAGEKLNSLTQRERQVLKLLIQGLEDATIAEALCVTPKTAAFHVGNILGKLDVASRQAAIAWAHTYLPEDLIISLG
jgi:DNA-binding NarL/FixJ family response regulator